MDEEKDMSGASGKIVNGTALEFPPPGDGFTTVTEAVPLLPRSLVGSNAVNTVLET